MKIHQIQSQGFRNLSSKRLEVFPGVNLFLGQNGQGKTNVLEMINLLTTLKSFRQAKRDDMMAWGNEVFHIEATISHQGLEKEVTLSWSKNSRTLKVNGSRLKDLRAYFTQMKSVCFSPEDIGILHGSPKVRRNFMDRLVFQCNPHHLFLVQEYQRVLQQRNACLKNWQINGAGEPPELNVWTEKMLMQAAKLTQSRLKFMIEINEVLPKLYAKVAGRDHEEGILKGTIHIDWLVKKEILPSSFHSYDDLLQHYQDEFQRTASGERFRGNSLWGPHLEDYNLFYGDSRAERFASTGQKKTLLLALRLTELEMVTKSYQESPLLLLDDLSAELDSKRLGTLISFLAEEMNQLPERPQVFITTVSPTFEIYRPLGELHTFQVNEGSIS